MEVSEYLVGSPAFKAGGTGDPRTAGSIPVHLRCYSPQGSIRPFGPRLALRLAGGRDRSDRLRSFELAVFAARLDPALRASTRAAVGRRPRPFEPASQLRTRCFRRKARSGPSGLDSRCGWPEAATVRTGFAASNSLFSPQARSGPSGLDSRCGCLPRICVIFGTPQVQKEGQISGRVVICEFW